LTAHDCGASLVEPFGRFLIMRRQVDGRTLRARVANAGERRVCNGLVWTYAIDRAAQHCRLKIRRVAGEHDLLFSVTHNY